MSLAEQLLRPELRADAATALLHSRDQKELKSLWVLASDTLRHHFGNRVHLRGLLEISNRCQRDCGYCGMRVSQRELPRFLMSQQEILDAVKHIAHFGYDTIVLQAGEDWRISPDWIAELISKIKQAFKLPITLSLGERPIEDYALWRRHGADRYLLKFETSDQKLFQKIHPARSQNAPSRLELLYGLRELGYSIGTGILLGLPGQTLPSLAEDLEIFAKLQAEMISIGPYRAHPKTPMGKQSMSQTKSFWSKDSRRVEYVLRMTAMARVLCPNAHMPATTAILHSQHNGLEQALKAGANVVMMNVSPQKYRRLYDIYPLSPAVVDKSKKITDADLLQTQDQDLRNKLSAMRKQQQIDF